MNSENAKRKVAQNMKLLVNGAMCREVREALGMTQEELARRAPIGRRTLQDIEGNKRHVWPETVYRLAGALGIDPRELATEKGRRLDPRFDVVAEIPRSTTNSVGGTSVLVRAG